MSGHTPGPWAVKPKTVGIYAGGDTRVAIAGEDVKSPLPLAQRKANAALIAAAPELLELLRSALHGVRGIRGFKPWADAAEALLARVDGQEPAP